MSKPTAIKLLESPLQADRSTGVDLIKSLINDYVSEEIAKVVRYLNLNSPQQPLNAEYEEAVKQLNKWKKKHYAYMYLREEEA